MCRKGREFYRDTIIVYTYIYKGKTDEKSVCTDDVKDFLNKKKVLLDNAKVRLDEMKVCLDETEER